MPADSRYTDEQKDEVVELYRRGIKGADISERTGIPRPTVYLILEQRGIKPSRRNTMKARQVDTATLLEQLAERDRLIGRLEEQLVQARAQIAFLQAQLTDGRGG